MKLNPIVILMADDDKDDQLLTKEALMENQPSCKVYSVEDGVELLSYLRQTGSFADPGKAPRPGLILLDLNMPRMDGRKALAEIKKDANLRSIPVVIFSTSDAEQDKVEGYELGAASFLKKPVSFDGLVELMDALCEYWFEFVSLPAHP